MELILTERVENLGQLGDIVKVKGGYARNFLLPQGKAILANKDNLKKFEKERSQREAENLKSKTEASKLSEEMRDLNLILIRSASETGQLYGSVNSRDIMKGIIDKGFNINHQQVILDQPIKELGLIKVKIKLHPEIIISILLNVARSLEESAIQQKTGIAVIDKPDSEKNNFDDKENSRIENQNSSFKAKSENSKSKKLNKEEDEKSESKSTKNEQHDSDEVL